MSTIVFVLVLLSFTTFLSNAKIAGLPKTLITAPLFILLGYALSPQGLGLLLPSVTKSLNPALLLAVFWISFMSGMDLAQSLRVKRWHAGEVIPDVLICATVFALVWFFSRLNWFPPIIFESRLALSLALSFIFLRKISPASLILSFLSFGALANQIQGVEFAMLFGLTLGLAGMLAICFLLVNEGKQFRGPQVGLALVGIAILGSGMAVNSSSNVALIAILFGLLLMFFYRPARILQTTLVASKEPVIMVLYFFAGVHLLPDLNALALGLAIAAARVLLLFVFPRPREFGQEFGYPAFAIAFILSLGFSRADNMVFAFLLTTFSGALVCTEILGIFLLPLEGKIQNA